MNEVKQVSEEVRGFEDVEDELRRLMKFRDWAKSEINSLKEEVKELKSADSSRQPKKKLKISKEKELPNGETVKKIGCEELVRVKEACVESRGLNTSDVEMLLANQDVERSRPTVIRIMKRLGAEFKFLKACPPKKGVRRSWVLRYNG